MKLIHELEKSTAALKGDVWDRLMQEPTSALRMRLAAAYHRLHDAQMVLEQARIEARTTEYNTPW